MIRALTDVGNAERFIERYSDRVRYATSVGFLLWDERRWRRDEEALGATQLAIDTAKSILQELDEVDDPDVREALRKWARASQGVARIKAILELARTDPRLVVRAKSLDSDPWLLNLLNGTLDLRTGELRRHIQNDLITKLAPVIYDPNATAPLWDGVLTRAFNGDPVLIGYLRRVFGYAMTGSAREQKLWVFWGTGENGKTTITEAVVVVLGEYACHTPADTILEKRSERVSNDLARLAGVRLVSISETKRGGKLDESLIKNVTGGEEISARFLYREPFEFQPTFTPVLQSNFRPVIVGADRGIWRRLTLLPFTEAIPESEQDKKLPDRLKGEAAGILNWMLAGCLEWQRDGLRPPRSVVNATAQYQRESDRLGDFIEACVVEDANACVESSELYRAYLAACEADGEKRPLSKRSFGMGFSERGCQRSHSNGSWYEGIRLRRPDDPSRFELFMRECRNRSVSFVLTAGDAGFAIVGTDIPTRLASEIERYSDEILKSLIEGAQNGNGQY